MNKNWKIGYTDEQGKTAFFSFQGSSESPTKNEVASALLARLSDRVYPGNSAESLQRNANNLLESEGYTIVSILPDNDCN